MFPQAGSRFLWQMLYNLLLPVALLGARIAARRNPKLRETLSGQRTASKRMQGSLPGRDPARPLLWFHVASAGEFLQALPVLERCVASGAQAVLTVTSVSGMRWVERRRGELPVLAADYLPLDTSRNARRLLETLEPAALIFTKYDLWPNLVWTAASAGVPQFLISATLHARSWRARSALARSLYRTLYAPLAGIFAVTEDDAERFLQTCPGHPGVAVVGDTRFDSVLERRDRVAVPPLPPYEDRVGAAKPQGMVQRNGIVLVIGSSWPPDEACYLPGLLEALERYPILRVVLVPHEIDPGHLVAMEETFAAYSTARFSQLSELQDGFEVPRWRVLLVDAVGILSALYAHADLAYVGGAFTTGVHNVMEPAAMGAPPVFGPFHQNSPEAMALLADGLAFAVTNSEDFRRVLNDLLADRQHLEALGARARASIEAQAGAAERSMRRIREALAERGAWPTPASGGSSCSDAAQVRSAAGEPV